MIGTFGHALEVRKINARDGKLTTEVAGEVECAEDGVLVVKRIHVTHTLTAAKDQMQTAERVHGVYAQHCPLYRSVKDAIAVSSSLSFVPE
ncbi:MAG TPA: OsmC family protein [Candidatus Saccharimonadales bacterium]|nr:OsmC family protein [Candidatus Saccharimonadales bacterium]